MGGDFEDDDGFISYVETLDEAERSRLRTWENESLIFSTSLMNERSEDDLPVDDSHVDVRATTPTQSEVDSHSSLEALAAGALRRFNAQAVETFRFKCYYPGCSAPLFKTQYLLNSHAKVHSSTRPHYCPIRGCLRGKGGKGFKRKNEMIRHGLVHESPGYVCPYCKDREHRYPRPVSLQRLVSQSKKDNGNNFCPSATSH
jgi:hypothetical protein